MIELGTGTISILYADGTSASFDPEELRLRLEKCFTESEQVEPWIANEIVLAVEYALRCRFSAESGKSETVIHAGDIDDCVVRILEDAGYPVAANGFRTSAVTSGDLGKIRPEDIESCLTGKLQMTPPAASELADRIRKAMQAIGAEQCSPRLVIELARFFREASALSHRLPVPALQTNESGSASAPAVSHRDMPCHVRRSDSIFASIRADINLPELFKGCTLTPPLTELSLTPRLLPVAEQIDAECMRLRKNGAEKYPLLLTLRGFTEFATVWLSFEQESHDHIQKKWGPPFMEFICSLLHEKPFKIFMH